MNYHFIIDSLFVENFAKAAEAISAGQNRFIFPYGSVVNNIRSVDVTSAPFGSDAYKAICEKIGKGDKVFIHWFSNDLMRMVEGLHPQVDLYLMFWGGDFLEQTPSFFDFNYDKQTKKYLKREETILAVRWSKNPFFWKRQLSSFLVEKQNRRREYETGFVIRKNLLSRANFFCHWNFSDYARIIREYKQEIRFKSFFYGIDFNIVPADYKKTSAKAIVWLGNSATPTNNHLDAIEVLKRFKSESIQVYCPLSYGRERYSAHVNKVGTKCFGKNWVGMLKMVPAREYYSILNMADVAVMFHNRQQASGNIMVLLYMGKKVYVKPSSTIYTFLQENGLKVFDTNVIKDIGYEDFVSPLSEEQVKNNRQIVSQLFSEERRMQYLSDILTGERQLG